jgi:hypothetical protein
LVQLAKDGIALSVDEHNSTDACLKNTSTGCTTVLLF